MLYVRAAAALTSDWEKFYVTDDVSIDLLSTWLIDP